MTRLNAIVGAAVGALALSTAVYAADMPGSWLPPSIGNALPSEIKSGWYLRGDLAYRIDKIDSVNSTDPVISHSYDNVVGAGLGAGYKFQWFRVDVTVDYGMPAKFQGTTAAAVPQPQYEAKIETGTVLANAYLDLGTWYGVTPYAGAGIGGSVLHVLGYHNNNLPIGENVPSSQRWSVSWAWMAGMNVQVSQRWSVDVGYRQLFLGDAVSGIESTGAVTTWKKLSAQEARVGLRFLID